MGKVGTPEKNELSCENGHSVINGFFLALECVAVHEKEDLPSKTEILRKAKVSEKTDHLGRKGIWGKGDLLKETEILHKANV